VEKKVQQSPLGDLLSEERGHTFSRFVWAGRQNASCDWVIRLSRKALCETYF